MGLRGLVAKAGYTVAVIFAVPLIAALLLVWTVVGVLCSLGGIPAFLLVAALLVSSGFADTTIGDGSKYAFDSSLLDPACALLVAYACYLFLLRHHDSSAALAGRGRLAAFPVALATTAFFSAKLVAVSGNDAQERWGWKLTWLWVTLVSSLLVYVSMARWWTNVSMPRLQAAEAALLKTYGEVEFEQSVVGGLGTVIVKGFHDPYLGDLTSEGLSSDKPVLVLVHGYAAGNGFWMFVLKELSKHFRVACVEMYGCGRSDRIPFNAKGPTETEEVLVESLERWRVAMGVEEMVLCGHSLGGMMAAAYAMAHPDRLRKLFLLSPAGVGGIPPGGDARKNSLLYKVYSLIWTRGLGFLFVLRWAGPFGARITKLMIAKRLSWVPEAAKIKDVDEGLLSEYVFQLLALPPSGEKIIFPLLDPMLHAYRPVMETLKGGGTIASSPSRSDGAASAVSSALAEEEEIGGHDRLAGEDSVVEDGGGVEGARGITCPVSIIYGSPDHDWMPSRLGVTLAENLTRQGVKANVYCVPEAGHTLIIDNPDEFTKIFLEAYFETVA